MLNSSLLKAMLLTIGILSTALGVIGIFVPLLPTVPFLLLAAACFARSSERCHRWLMEHNHLGPILRSALHGEGIPRRVRIMALSMLWLSISTSCILIPLNWARALLITVAVLVSIYLLRLPAQEKTPP